MNYLANTNHKKILIVEDEFIISSDLALTLKRMGYVVAGNAITGEEAVTKAFSLEPDLILMDIILKGSVSGIDAAVLIKEKLDIPIIYLTANSDNDTFERAKLTNPENFILKPIDHIELYTALEIALHKADVNKKLKENDSWLSATLNNIRDAVIAIDNDGLIKYVNTSGADIFCKPVKSVVNLNFFDVVKIFNNLDDKCLDNLRSAITQDKFEDWKCNLYYLNKNSEKVFIKLRAASIYNEKKDIIGNLVIFQDITKKLLEEKKAKEDAERSDKLKSQFLSQMSHEIRTPLNNILTFTSLLKEEVEDKLPAGLENCFEIIDSSGKRLIRTIDLLLNMSKIISGYFEADYQLIDIHNDILEDLTYSYFAKAKDKGLELIYINNTTGKKVIADKYSMEQIFNNLIDNAIKYTINGFVRIEISEHEGNDLYVKIKDSGIGISQKDLPHIFSPFTQGNNPSNENLAGTGLGLALVKKYIDLNNGQIFVNTELDKGTEFTLIFKNVKG